VRERLKPLLPRAWWPDEIRVLAQLPLNANRKIDRGALAALLQPALPAETEARR
jgi:acyl-coenzyme A synthetase/AMP-(fatty) acid ligase